MSYILLLKIKINYIIIIVVMPRKAHIKEGEVLSTNEVLKRSLNSGLSGMSAMFI